jgi:uncharacterized protein YaeQ
MSRKLHREISHRWFRIGAYDEQKVKNRTSRSARTAAVVAASIASMPAIREMALLMPDAVPAWLSAAPMTVVVSGATLTAMPSPSTAIERHIRLLARLAFLPPRIIAAVGLRPAVWRKDIKVSDDGVKQDLAQRARAFPGQESLAA